MKRSIASIGLPQLVFLFLPMLEPAHALSCMKSQASAREQLQETYKRADLVTLAERVSGAKYARAVAVWKGELSGNQVVQPFYTEFPQTGTFPVFATYQGGTFQDATACLQVPYEDRLSFLQAEYGEPTPVRQFWTQTESILIVAIFLGLAGLSLWLYRALTPSMALKRGLRDATRPPEE